MKNPQNITIVLLLASAAILTALVATTYVNTGDKAYADTGMKQREYTIATGALSDNIDLMYVIDAVAKRLNCYAIDQNSKSITIVDSRDLRRDFAIR